ncbi:hypothetical protein J6590_108858 [Homalodisca vitripennis]|nr:hypothetical protein J6590_108858 [Homalodisca vitripennis]
MLCDCCPVDLHPARSQVFSDGDTGPFKVLLGRECSLTLTIAGEPHYDRAVPFHSVSRWTGLLTDAVASADGLRWQLNPQLVPTQLLHQLVRVLTNSLLDSENPQVVAPLVLFQIVRPFRQPTVQLSYHSCQVGHLISQFSHFFIDGRKGCTHRHFNNGPYFFGHPRDKFADNILARQKVVYTTLNKRRVKQLGRLISWHCCCVDRTRCRRRGQRSLENWLPIRCR